MPKKKSKSKLAQALAISNRFDNKFAVSLIEQMLKDNNGNESIVCEYLSRISKDDEIVAHTPDDIDQRSLFFELFGELSFSEEIWEQINQVEPNSNIPEFALKENLENAMRNLQLFSPTTIEQEEKFIAAIEIFNAWDNECLTKKIRTALQECQYKLDMAIEQLYNFNNSKLGDQQEFPDLSTDNLRVKKTAQRTAGDLSCGRYMSAITQKYSSNNHSNSNDNNRDNNRMLYTASSSSSSLEDSFIPQEEGNCWQLNRKAEHWRTVANRQRNGLIHTLQQAVRFRQDTIINNNNNNNYNNSNNNNNGDRTVFTAAGVSAAGGSLEDELRMSGRSFGSTMLSADHMAAVCTLQANNPHLRLAANSLLYQGLAAQELVDNNNAHGKGPHSKARVKIDLHGLLRHEALQFVDSVIAYYCRDRDAVRPRVQVCLVVGRGLHSLRGVSVLGPAVENKLSRLDLKYQSCDGEIIFSL